MDDHQDSSAAWSRCPKVGVRPSRHVPPFHVMHCSPRDNLAAQSRRQRDYRSVTSPETCTNLDPRLQNSSAGLALGFNKMSSGELWPRGTGAT
jgi:hypothetical protein